MKSFMQFLWIASSLQKIICDDLLSSVPRIGSVNGNHKAHQ